MTEYTELIRSLRCENTGDDECGSSDCPYWSGLGCMDGQLMEDAAAAIEELQQIADHYEQTAKDYWKEACDYKAQLEDRTNATELWKDMYLTKQMPQDEKDKILEYIRNAPIVPIGPLEPMRIELLPKHGEWIEDTTTYAGPGLSNYKCSLCGKICGTWRRGLEPSELPNWCGNCGADMRKMEVQDGTD